MNFLIYQLEQYESCVRLEIEESSNQKKKKKKLIELALIH